MWVAARSALVAAAAALGATALLLALGIAVGRGGAPGIGQVPTLLTGLFAVGLFLGAYVGTRSGLRRGADPAWARASGAAGAFAVWVALAVLDSDARTTTGLLVGFVLAAVAAAGGAAVAGRTRGTGTSSAR
jgi:hypothetical protein